jgi:hypothetical protein
MSSRTTLAVVALGGVVGLGLTGAAAPAQSAVAT